jgi:predicted nucleic acid-binding protein
MKIFVDTNVLGRLLEVGHPQHLSAANAVATLRRQGDELSVVPQILYELWVVSTRPLAVNGLGLTPNQAAAELARVQALFSLLPDTSAIFSEWQSLVVAHQVSGKNAHDTRLVAAMLVHGVTHLLTFNSVHFSRFPITVLDPAAVTMPPATP